MSDTNGGTDVSLPERRKAAVAAGLEQYNHIANERDKFEALSRDLQTQIAGYKVAAEADQSRILEMESRIKSMILERDQAVADRSAYEALFVSMFAQMRAFNIPAAPLVRDKSEQSDAQFALHSITGFSGHPGVPANVGQRTDNLSKTERSS